MAAREGLEIKASPLVLVFWQEAGMVLTLTLLKSCWELTTCIIYRKVDEGTISHGISFLDELAICILSHKVWEKFAWLPMAAAPRALQEPEPYSYCCRQVVDLGLVLPAAQFQVTNEAGNYLCMARALTFEGSVLAYNPTHNEAEWVPNQGLANDLTPGKERSTVALANYVLRVTSEAIWIARLGAS